MFILSHLYGIGPRKGKSSFKVKKFVSLSDTLNVHFRLNLRLRLPFVFQVAL